MSDLSRAIEKLHLEKGDILIVRDDNIIDVLMELPLDLMPRVPIIYAPSGLEKCDLQTLLDIVSAMTSGQNSPSQEN